jgi:hypothetical protein
MRVVSKVALRGLRHRERMQKLAEAAPVGVRVAPQEKYRKVLKHPTRGGFPAEGSVEWPDDRFTRRRLADGSVTREERAEEHRDSGDQRQHEQWSQSRHRVEHPKTDEPNSAA